MRELKFRAWDKSRHTMMKGDCNLMLNLNGQKFWQFGFNEPRWIEKENDHYTLMQHTGLKDKNGVEIYEGDVVRWDGGAYTRWLVEWDFAISGFVLTSGDEWDGIGRGDSHLYEVIGNIYENPELVEG